MSPVKVPLPALVHVLSHADSISDHAKPRRTNKADQVMAQEDWPETDVGGGACDYLPRGRRSISSAANLSPGTWWPACD
jgi:hypothetical protein